MKEINDEQNVEDQHVTHFCHLSSRQRLKYFQKPNALLNAEHRGENGSD